MRTGENCYLNCGGTMKHAFDKRGYEVLQCSVCSLKTLAFEKNYDAFLDEYYQEGYFEGGEDYCGYRDYRAEKKQILKNFAGYFSFIKKYVQQGTHLDVGCAAGYFVELMSARGYNSFGIDVSKYVIDLAEPDIRPKLQDVALHHADFNNQTFDVITMFDLVEHLADPRQDLLLARELLKEQGHLFLITGDIGSAYSKIFGKYNHFYAVPQHLFFFDRKTISVLLEEIGFEIEEIVVKGKWVSFEYLSQIAGLSLPFLKPLLDMPVVQRMLHDRAFYFQLGDTMMVSARKK